MANERAVWPDGKIVSPRKNLPSSDPRPGLSRPNAPLATLVMTAAQTYASNAVAAGPATRSLRVARPAR